MTFRLVGGDAIQAMQAMAENSVDAIVTDPPYGLEFMGKEWDRFASQDTTARVQRSGSSGFGESKFRTGTKGVRNTFRCRSCGGWSGSFSEARAKRQRACECPNPDLDYAGAPSALLAFGEFSHAWATEALRILKPGGHLLAFGGTRTYHRLACAIEDAGFEIRDCIAWMYGSGFPKSLDVSKAIDKAAGAEREVVGVLDSKPGVSAGQKPYAKTPGGMIRWGDEHYRPEDAPQEALDYWANYQAHRLDVTAPATAEAQRWNGWGTALKPAFEPIVLARKPLAERNVAANVQRWGTGALNIDGCRIEGKPADFGPGTRKKGGIMGEPDGQMPPWSSDVGRWPANVTLGHSPDCEQTGETRKVKASRPASGPTLSHLGDNGIYGEADGVRATVPNYADADGLESVQVWKCVPGCAVAMLDEQTGELTTNPGIYREDKQAGDKGWGMRGRKGHVASLGDTGGASRFFYCPKADREERNRGLEHMAQRSVGIKNDSGRGFSETDPYRDIRAANHHPTVKPVELMRWLCRMVTPKGGTVLDPFTGSGSTGVAAMREGFEFIGIEREAEYVEIARARIFGDAPLFNVEAEYVPPGRWERLRAAEMHDNPAGGGPTE